MSGSELPQATEPPRPAAASERVALAQLALEGALSVEGVVSSSAGPSGVWITADDSGRVPGVVAAALRDGGYGLSLHLVVRPVPLHALAERVRERVARNAATAGLGEVLGPVDVSIEDVVSRAEDVV
jgi:hypothetical protein